MRGIHPIASGEEGSSRNRTEIARAEPAGDTHGGDGLCHRHSGDERDPSHRLGRGGQFSQQNRDRQSRTGRRHPRSIEPPPSGRLVVGEEHRQVRPRLGVRREHAQCRIRRCGFVDRLETGCDGFSLWVLHSGQSTERERPPSESRILDPVFVQPEQGRVAGQEGEPFLLRLSEQKPIERVMPDERFESQ